jgi:predicted MFS family arabinose efflux permease
LNLPTFIFTHSFASPLSPFYNLLNHIGMDKQSIPKCLYLVFFTTFLYSWAYLSQAPLLPFIVKEMDGDNAAFGRIQSVFSLVQIIGGLLTGPLLDMFGGKSILVASFFASVLLYVGTASSYTLNAVIVTRLPALFQHAVLAARTIVTEWAAPNQRSVLLGYLSACSGLGFVLGPMSGGKLASMTSLRQVAWISAGVSAFAGLLIAFLLPPDACSANPPKQLVEEKKLVAGKESVKEKESPAKKMNMQNLISALQNPVVANLLLIKAAITLPTSLVSTLLPLVLRDSYQFNPQGVGNVLSFVGVVMLASQLFLIRPVEQRLGDGHAMKYATLIMGLSYCMMALLLPTSYGLEGLMIALIPSTAASTISSTINTALLTKRASNFAGSVIAIDMALFSITRMIAPLFGTLLMERFGFASVVWVGSALLLFAFLALARQEKLPKNKMK